jgi:hypothetical protein
MSVDEHLASVMRVCDSGRILAITKAGEKIYFPTQKTKNKELQKEFLQFYLGIIGKAKLKEPKKINCEIKNNSKNTPIVSKLNWELAIKLFSGIPLSNFLYKDNSVICSIKFEDSDFRLTFLYSEGQNVKFILEQNLDNFVNIDNEKWLYMNDITAETIKQYVEFVECCICLEECDTVGFKCKTCNEGIVCKNCVKKMKLGVKKCPVCRT